MEILRQSYLATIPKRMSTHPQNICAQAPNVFSRNEYEPVTEQTEQKRQQQKKRKLNSDQATNFHGIIEDREDADAENEESTSKKMMTIAAVNESDENDEKLAVGNEVLKHLGATYSEDINAIDFDNPQLYHEIYTTSTTVKQTLDQFNEVDDNNEAKNEENINGIVICIFFPNFSN